MRTGLSGAVIPVLAVALVGNGCMVLSSKYEAKTREADALRDAIAVTNKEKGALETRYEALQKQLSDEKETSASLSMRLREQAEASRKINDELSATRKNYEGTRITREQLIAELMEKEKSTGKRIQDLGGRLQQCEADGEKARQEAVDRQAELAELRRKAEKPSMEEEVRRERDILLGRVERLTEERRREEKRRDERFASLAETLAGIGRGVRADVLGPALRVGVPDGVLRHPGKGGLTDAGRAVVEALRNAASEFQSASIVLYAGEKAAAEIRALLEREPKIPNGRIMATYLEKEKGAEIFLLVP